MTQLYKNARGAEKVLTQTKSKCLLSTLPRERVLIQDGVFPVSIVLFFPEKKDGTDIYDGLSGDPSSGWRA